MLEHDLRESSDATIKAKIATFGVDSDRKVDAIAAALQNPKPPQTKASPVQTPDSV